MGFKISYSIYFSDCNFTEEDDPSVAKPPLNVNGGFAKIGLTFLVR